LNVRLVAGALAGVVFAPLGATAQTAQPPASVPTATPAQVPTITPSAGGIVVRTTLANGLRVVLLPDRLAPVATTAISYGVGSDDDTMPGLAHATEHMLFRGTKDVSAGQFADIAARAGAEYDAQTSNYNTLFFFKLPSAYVPLALRLEADRMNGATIAADAWKTERGAIEQEIRADQSVPGWAISERVRHAVFGTTPYAEDAGGTIPSFEKMTAADISRFYQAWYHPNNATLVVAGDIDPTATLAQIHAVFDTIPAQSLPVRAPIVVSRPAASTIDGGIAELPVPVVGLAYRFPSLGDPDYAAGQVLAAALNNGRGALADLTAQGSALFAAAIAVAYPEIGVGEIIAAGPPTGTTDALQASLRGVVERYRVSGIPDNLVQAAKTRLLSQQSYRQASISGLAFAWSNSLAQHRDSPDDVYNAIARVTAADVNRVLRQNMVPERSVTISLRPRAMTSLPKVNPNAGVENVKFTPDVHEPLPSWATAYFDARLRAPKNGDLIVTRLPNGMRLTVRRTTFSPVVVLSGHIHTSAELYEPAGKSGVSSLTESLLPWGTATYDRKAYQAQLDAIAADVTLGPDFAMTVESKNFDRAIALLADGLLHPAFPASAFELLKRNTAQSLAAVENQPRTQAAVAQSNALYPLGDPRRRRPTAKTVDAVSPQDVRRWYSFSYRPDLTTIAIVGDVTPAQARESIARYFGSWKARGAPPTFRFPMLKAGKSETVTVKSPSSQQSEVTLTQVIGVHRGDIDTVALDLANTILSGEDTGSMLFRNVRTDKGYVYSIDSSMDIGASSSTFSIDFASDPKNAQKAQAAAVSVIRRLQTTPLPLADLQRAKALLLAQRVLPLDSYSGLASNLLDDVIYSYTGADADAYWQRLVDTTPKQLQAAMKRWIDPNHFVRVVVAPGG
jgi:zinc protease